jgi:hypothetical protein
MSCRLPKSGVTRRTAMTCYRTSSYVDRLCLYETIPDLSSITLPTPMLISMSTLHPFQPPRRSSLETRSEPSNHSERSPA